MKRRTQTILVSLMLIVSLSMTAQKAEGLKVGVKSIKELLKEQSDCSYCSQAYHFVNSVKRIKADVKRLVSAKPKRKGKITKKLTKRLEALAKYAGEEWRGLTVEIQTSESHSEAHKNAIKLQLHLEGIQEVLSPPEFEAIEPICESLDRIKELHTHITKTLKQ